MPNYLAFVYGKIPAPGPSATADGEDLARQCLVELGRATNQEQFPPRLLVLLASPAYANEAACTQLLHGVVGAFAAAGHEAVKLLGCTVAAVFCNEEIYERGALLVCLASRLLEAEIAVSLDAHQQLEAASSQVLNELGLNFMESGEDPNPLVDRLLLTFLPGAPARYSGAASPEECFPAPLLHRLLRRKLRARVPVVGGVTAANTPEQPGWQFAGTQVYQNALVAARLSTGFPFTSSIVHGLRKTAQVLRVTATAEHGQFLTACAEGQPAEQLGLRKPTDFALCGELSLGGDPVVNIARLAPDGQAVRMLRPVAEQTCFRVFAPEPEQMLVQRAQLSERALQRLKVTNPVGCLGIHCNARRQVLAMEPNARLTNAFLKRPGAYVGGFFDGEIGQDSHGLSVFGNWCVADLFFGDELRQRTPIQRGFEAQAVFAPRLAGYNSLDEAIQHSLELIYETGFPGAMISLVLSDQGKSWLVARPGYAIGSRFQRIVAQTKRPFDQPDVLPYVAQTGQPLFVGDSTQHELCNQTAVQESGIISQYLIPLKNAYGETFAVLQVDLGDLRYLKLAGAAPVAPPHKKTLDLLGAVIESALMRIHNREEIRLARKLDEALQKSLTQPALYQALQCFLGEALKAFGADGGHIRRANDKEKVLVMHVGQGEYFEVFKKGQRRAIKFNDPSPTSEAFRAGRTGQAVDPAPRIVNCAAHNFWHQQYIARYQENERARRALTQIRSYANAPIRLEGGKIVGTITLQAQQEWFFTRPRAQSLQALSQRLGVLYETVKRREDVRQGQANTAFLHQCSTRLPEQAQLSPRAALAELTQRFRKAADAHLAALFLWDEETQKYVLRAQDGWANPAWLNSAAYRRGERWTGRAAQATEPQLVEDMYGYKKQQRIEQDSSYAHQMFGYELSEEHTVAALGLPFATAAGAGILTLYRRLPVEAETTTPPGNWGFKTLNRNALKAAGDILAANISAQLRQLRADWELGERERHDAVCHALENSAAGAPLAARLCRQAAASFLAHEVRFYEGEELAASACYSCTEQPLRPADAAVKRAAQTRQLIEIRHQAPPTAQTDPAVARTDGLVERVCLPLLTAEQDERLVGVLDLHFGVVRTQVPPLERPHNREYLEKLGRKLAPAYLQQQQLERQRESELREKRSRLAVETMSAMVVQTAHRLLNLVAEIRAMPTLIKNAPDEQTRAACIAQLAQLISAAPEKIQRPLDVARRVKDITPRLHDLRGLLLKALDEANIAVQRPDIELELDVPRCQLVRLDQELTREVFHNIINNALKAMPNTGRLRISASFLTAAHAVEVVFADTGVGMSKEEQEAAEHGFFTTQSSSGLGLLISRLLLQAQNGDLRIESAPGAGARIILTLPFHSQEGVYETFSHFDRRRQLATGAAP